MHLNTRCTQYEWLDFLHSWFPKEKQDKPFRDLFWVFGTQHEGFDKVDRMRERAAFLEKQNAMMSGSRGMASFGKSASKNIDLSDFEDEQDDVLNSL